MSSFLRQGLRYVIVVLIVTVAIELSVFMWLRGGPRRGPVPPPSGVLLSGKPFDAAGHSCHLLRITSDSCPYCKQDHEVFLRLAHKAQQLSCSVVALAPRAGGMAAVTGATYEQLEYVPLSFGAAIDPFLTPQTIVLNRSGSVMWWRAGVMSGDDEASASEKLRDAGSAKSQD
jgi:hypothetical protein